MEANATPRDFRGKVQRSERQVVRDIERRVGSKANAGQRIAAFAAGQDGKQYEHPAAKKFVLDAKVFIRTCEVSL